MIKNFADKLKIEALAVAEYRWKVRYYSIWWTRKGCVALNVTLPVRRKLIPSTKS
jgi:hypothetical protein